MNSFVVAVNSFIVALDSFVVALVNSNKWYNNAFVVAYGWSECCITLNCYELKWNFAICCVMIRIEVCILDLNNGTAR